METKTKIVLVALILLVGWVMMGCEKDTPAPKQPTEKEVITGKHSYYGKDVCFPPCNDSIPPPPSDTLELCCSYYDPIEPRYYFCWTANDDCTTCDSICNEWYNGNFKPDTKELQID